MEVHHELISSTRGTEIGRDPHSPCVSAEAEGLQMPRAIRLSPIKRRSNTMNTVNTGIGSGAGHQEWKGCYIVGCKSD